MIRRQKIYRTDEFNVPLAEEVLAPGLAQTYGMEWDIALLASADRIYKGIPLHINLRPESFRTLAYIERSLPLRDMKEMVVLEILELGINGHVGDIIKVAKLGYILALDDFGCREANWDLLSKLTPEIMPIIKLDMHFMHRNDPDLVMSNARGLQKRGYKVYLEGVESPAHMLDCCNAWQGWLFHKPEEECVELRTPLESARA